MSAANPGRSSARSVQPHHCDRTAGVTRCLKGKPHQLKALSFTVGASRLSVNAGKSPIINPSTHP